MSRAGRGEPMAFIRAHINDPHSDGDPCVLWPHWRTHFGYGSLVVGGRNRVAHVVLLELRDGLAPVGHEALHGPCHNRACIIHVRWGTRAENYADRVRDGTEQRGERNPNARLSASDVKAMRTMLGAGVSQTVVAREFGVTQPYVSKIIAGSRWSHV